MDLERLFIVLQAHKGKTLGILIGLAVSLFVIYFGIIKTFFVIFCCLIGALVGKIIDDGESVQIWIKKNIKDFQ